MKLSLLIFLTFLFVEAIAQDTLYTSYNDNFQITPDSLATHRGILIKEDEAWRASVYSLQNSKLAMVCYLTEKDFQLDGLCRIYSLQGNVIERGYYHDNLKEGLWKMWDGQGHLIDSTIYEHSQPKIGVSYSYTNNVLREYRFVDYSSNHKISKNWNEKSVLTMEGEFFNKKGTLKNYYLDGETSFAEYDEKGKSSIKYYDEKGAEISKKEIERRSKEEEAKLIAQMPEFRGGSTALGNFIKNNFIRVVTTGVIPVSGTLEIEFFLDEKGRAVNYKCLNNPDRGIENSLTMLFNKMPPWIMKGFKSWGPVHYNLIIH